MPTQDDVRQLALALPETAEDPSYFRFFVRGKQLAWVFPERIDPRKARVPNSDVLVVWVGSELEKQALLSMDPKVFFTTPHYDGYPAVLVRLPAIDRELLARLLTDAWRLRAPKRIVAEWERGRA